MYIHTLCMLLCMRAAKDLASLRNSVGSPEPSLLDYVISTSAFYFNLRIRTSINMIIYMYCQKEENDIFCFVIISMDEVLACS